MENFANDSAIRSTPQFVNFETAAAAAAAMKTNFSQAVGSYPATDPTYSYMYIGRMGEPSTQASTAAAAAYSTPKNIPVVQTPRRPMGPGRNPATKAQGDQAKMQTMGRPPLIPGLPISNAIPFTLSATDVVCFFGRNHFLSTFYSAQFEVEGHRYFSVEHYYEAVKLFTFLGPFAAAQLQNVKDAAAAKALSKRMLTEGRVDRRAVDQWRNGDAITVVMHALKLKFQPGTELAQKLMATGAALLAQTNPHDNQWAVNMDDKDFLEWMKQNDKRVIYLPAEITVDTVKSLPWLGRKGKNLLGFLLMEIRRQLQGMPAHETPGVPFGRMQLIVEENEEPNATAGNPIGQQVAGVSVLQQRQTAGQKRPNPGESMCFPTSRLPSKECICASDDLM